MHGQAGVRRRPADRKQRIIAAAADLFRDQGYHDVSLADVAEVVGITGPALYKHFRNKEDLLRRAVDHGIDDLAAAIAGAATIDEFIAERTAATRERHNLVALWQREARHLPAEQQRELRDRVGGLIRQVGELIRTARPELSGDDADFLALGLLSVFASLANHRISLPPRQFERLLGRLSHVVVNFRMVRSKPNAANMPARRPGAIENALPRREQLLATATELIDERGFHSVHMSDIGAAIGVTGSSIYKHYSSKADLLVAALDRGYDRLQSGIVQALSRARTSREALQLLLRADIDFAQQNRSVIGILMSERDQLPAADLQRANRAQRDIMQTWTRVLGDAYPGLGPVEARITVNVVFAVVNSVLRTRRFAGRPDIADQLESLGLALLATR